MGRLRGGLSVFLLAFAGAGSLQANDDAFAELEQEIQAGSEGLSSGADDFEKFKQARAEGFESYKERTQKEFKAFAELHRRVEEAYRDRVAKVWAVPEQSSKTRWVQYEAGYEERHSIDFEQGVVTLSAPADSVASESLTESKARQALSDMMVMTRREAFEKDEVAAEVEAQSKRKFQSLETAELDDSPILQQYLFGAVDVSPEMQRQAVSTMMARAEKSTAVEGGQEVVSWTVPLNRGDSDSKLEKAPEEVSVAPASAGVWKTRGIAESQIDNLPARAQPFVAAINRENAEFELSAELLLAIMETESAFNPLAKSPIPAFGLMQIVPASAGQDASEKLFGQPRLLAPSFLYNPEQNIQVGAAYFNILYYRYFRGIEDPLSRLYCAIAAYNTGPGNVSRALTGSSMALKPAIRVANEISPEQVYEHLMANLPYEETINYLRKVTQRLAAYEELLANG